ncbi:ATP-binding protein [Paraburkholderia antibiotica]|uniref:SpoIIE family protein phosphatase n=1 Tax=Paraburkholderia antibiotica TaxID=2728839 RepID=A0A7X9X2L1_9BURK|nr:ATP-binding protein [Paraburkholderia antibiotica]NML30298.1 SpoIIE family protein phosphatase [Paraburkholderia antibiotica]
MEAVLNQSSAMQQRFEIADPSQISFARRGIGELAQRVGCGETAIGRLAIVATECATNQLKHAQRGELLARTLSEIVPSGSSAGSSAVARNGVELIAIDNGPGIHDLHACFVDGYTTAGSPGNGMGAIRRLADELDIWSAPGLGTLLRIVVWAESAGVANAATTTAGSFGKDAASDAGSSSAAAPAATTTGYAPDGAIEYGAINVPLQGEDLCGDAWSCGYADGEFTVMIADGLGHGPLAYQAARAAVDNFAQVGASSLEQIVVAAHNALRPTRGAALGVARIPAGASDGSSDAVPDAAPEVARFCGIGNIAASVWTSHSHRHLVSHAGIAGHQMHKAQTFQLDWPRDALLILHSDGLATRWDLNRYPGLTLRHPALIAAALYRDFARGRDDLTVFVARVRCKEPL